MTGQKLAVCSACNWQTGKVWVRKHVRGPSRRSNYNMTYDYASFGPSQQAAGNLPALICSFDFNSDQQPQATGQTVRHAACRMKDFVCHSFQVLMSLLSTRNWFAALILTRSCHNKKVSSYKLGNPRGALYMFQSATKRTQVRIHCLRRFWQPQLL